MASCPGGVPIRFLLNDAEVETTLPPGTPTLDFLRRHRRLRGTKEGCREGECGACTVLVGRIEDEGMRYRTAVSCLLPLAELHATHVLTVEGLGPSLTSVQEALGEQHAIQCGFCTPGIVMSLTGFFSSSRTLSEQDAVDALDGNICRCTGYVSIRRAACWLSARFRERLDPKRSRCEQLVEWGILPRSCSGVGRKLEAMRRAGEARRGGDEASPDTGLVGGATDLLVQQPERLEAAASLRFASQLRGTRGIGTRDGVVLIGGATTVEELRESRELADALPALARSLAEDLKLFASTPLRNRATVAGNLVNASPIGDLSIVLLALDAKLDLVIGNQRREVPLRRFYKGYRSVDLQPGEVVETIAIPLRDLLFHFEKVSRRRVLDIASVNTALCVEGDGQRPGSVALSAGGVAAIPLYLERCSRFLSGKRVDTPTARRAIDIAVAETAPISDVRGSAAYKRLLLRNLVVAHLLALFPGAVDGPALLEAPS